MPVSTPTIKYEKRNRIAYITLNRPEVLNALSRELSAGLREALEDFRDDRDALVAIMTGEGGRAFSAGMDLKERASLDAKGERRSPTRRGGSFIDLEVFKPIIAAIDGFCVAGGLELSLQCDMRIATGEVGVRSARAALEPDRRVRTAQSVAHGTARRGVEYATARPPHWRRAGLPDRPDTGGRTGPRDPLREKRKATPKRLSCALRWLSKPSSRSCTTAATSPSSIRRRSQGR